jgi:PAS domain S-box-containing protein
MAIPNSYDILQAVIEATPDAIFVKDLDGRYVLVNAAAARFLGRSPADIVGKRDLELYPEDTARRFIADDQLVLASGIAQSFEGVARGEAGTQAYLVTKGVYRGADGQILGLFGISHDITELRVAHETLEETREALFRSQKMEAVGQLTGGIAHDFNNILSVILGNLELLRMHLKKDAYAQELIDAVFRAAVHGQDLTGDLLAFARRRQLNPQPVHINGLVEGIVRLLGRTIGGRVRIITATTDDAGVVMADRAALEAAILNIALNARDAMPDGGSLTIRTSRLEVDDSHAAECDVAPGSYAMLAFTDTGHGMPPDVAARVFEPFFTTKGAQGGTGLGLSMVYGFAKQSGGSVSVESQPERGTTLRMLLPLTGEDPRPESARAGSPAAAASSRTILLVEDESAVRNTVRRQLESLGHRVLLAESAAVALTLLGDRRPIDLLLSDVVLGAGINGIDVAERARQLRPTLPVIFISGYTTVSESEARCSRLGAALLLKPVTLSQLSTAIAAAQYGAPKSKAAARDELRNPETTGA